MNKDETYKRFGSTFELIAKNSPVCENVAFVRNQCACGAVGCMYIDPGLSTMYAGFLLTYGKFVTPYEFVANGELQ